MLSLLGFGHEPFLGGVPMGMRRVSAVVAVALLAGVGMPMVTAAKRPGKPGHGGMEFALVLA